MSLNIGTAACEAAKRLAGSEDWKILRGGIAEQVRATMNKALDTDPSNAPIAIGYARALRDIFLALDSATHGVPLQRTEKPSPLKGRGE